jgi:hypothetical protein
LLFLWTPSRYYSQNFEDLYLYRFFSSLDKGFYIDAGAWHPDIDSVTKIFYDQGWRGINIDAVLLRLVDGLKCPLRSSEALFHYSHYVTLADQYFQ